jgi:hypothetical protein
LLLGALFTRWVFPPPFFYFGGKLKIPKSEKREGKETDHRLTTPPFPSLIFSTLVKIALFHNNVDVMP